MRSHLFETGPCSKDTFAWLSDAENPSVRSFVLRDLLGKGEDDNEIREAKQAIMERGPVPMILSHQNPDGSFITKEMVAKYGEARARTGYQPKYKGTIWQAIFLAQLGADKTDERVRKLGHFILEANYNPEHEVFGIYVPTGEFRAVPCFVSNMIWSLSKLGFYEDHRLQHSIKWLLKYQRFDEGDFLTPKEWPYRGNQDRCFGKHSCFIGCTQALKAMTVMPVADRTREVEAFAKKAIDFILLHKVYKRSRGKGQPIRKEYNYFVFPLTYYDDVLGILESLLFFKVKDKSIDEAVDFILSKKNENGRWPLDKTVSSSSMYAKFEEQGKESKWITYRALDMLKKYGSVSHDKTE